MKRHLLSNHAEYSPSSRLSLCSCSLRHRVWAYVSLVLSPCSTAVFALDCYSHRTTTLAVRLFYRTGHSRLCFPETAEAKTILGENRCKFLFSGIILKPGIVVCFEHPTRQQWVKPDTAANARCSSSAREYIKLEEKKKEEGWCVHWQALKYQPDASAYPGWRHV